MIKIKKKNLRILNFREKIKKVNLKNKRQYLQRKLKNMKVN